MARVHFGRLVGPVGFARTVAIKSLHPGYAADSNVARMFMDEARVASRMRHPNVVPIVDVLALEGDLYLVMDYVPGMSLSRLFARLKEAKQSIPIPVAVAVMIDAFSGLHAAHETTGDRGEHLEIVHRDVSPHNLLVGEDGVTRVLDFGVAKAASQIESTAAGEIKGKIAYMPPEQLAGSDVDRRSDIFAGCIVLWEMLTLRRLFGRDDAGATVLAVMQGEIVPPSRYNPQVSPELDALVLRGLERSPDARFATALEVVRALEDVTRSATTREVGDWVRSLAGKTLDDAARLVADIENASVVTEAPAPIFAVPAPGVVPALLDGASSSASSRVARRGWVAAAIAAAFVLALTAVWARAPVGQSMPASSARETASDPPAAVETPKDVARAPVDPASAASSAASVPKAAKAATAPYRRGGPKVAVHSAAAPSGSIPGASASCRVLNPDGTFGYRPECLK